MDATVHGETVSYTHSSTTVSINGLWDEKFHMATQEGIMVESSGPGFTARTVDLSSVSAGDTIVRNSTTYFVRGIHPDGQGYTFLVLSKD
jgi:hypothetical protein